MMTRDLRRAPRVTDVNALGKAAVIGLGLVCLIGLGAGFLLGAAALLLAIIVAGGAAAFMAARSSGLRRRHDGVMHGIYSWLIVATSASMLVLPGATFGAGNTPVVQRVLNFIEVLRQPQRELDERLQLTQLLAHHDVRIASAGLDELILVATHHPARLAAYLRAELGAEAASAERLSAHIASLYRDAGAIAAEEHAAQVHWRTTTRTISLSTAVVLTSLLVSIWAGVAGVRRTVVRQ